MRKIMIAGTKSGVGKTTVTMGILAAFTKRMVVQPYKVGPDYIDPAFHTHITGRDCRNLDSFLMEEEVIKYLFNKGCYKADIAVVEGVMGLFDGKEIGSDIGTSSSIAKMVKAPVILVVDGSKVAASLAATVKGFEMFDPDLRIAGVIFNRVGSEAHYQLLKEAIAYYTDVIPCGYLTKDVDVTLPERHLGLVPTSELNEVERIFDKLASAVEATIDMEQILKIASMGEDISSTYEPIRYDGDKVRIAIAKDEAFHFYYKDSLDLLEDQLNVELIPFSPLSDEGIPEDVHGLIIGGGFPEMFARELSRNASMLTSIYDALNRGLPYIAECGGLMYLSEQLIDLEGKKHKMVGWLSGQTAMQSRLQRFGYASLKLDKDCLYGQKSDSIRVHEFHRSKAEIDEEQVYTLEKVKRGQQVRQWTCGYRKKNGIAAYAHLHYYCNTDFALNFVKKCRNFKKGGYKDDIYKRSKSH